MSKKRKRKNKKKIKSLMLKELRLFIYVWLLVFLVCASILMFFFSIYKVDGFGMLPTLRDKDVMVIQKKTNLKRFDLVYLNRGIQGEFRRIIGFPGEKIEIKDDSLLVNNEPFDEKYLVDKINEYQLNGKAFTENFHLSEIAHVNVIPDGYYLVLGDNRPYTSDSRDYGLVSSNIVIGKVIIRLFPFERAQFF